jgi:homoserine dehydrogenase
MDHPMDQAQGEGNAIVIETEEGKRIALAGKGAGRWPTAEAVVADLLDLWRERCVEAGIEASEASKKESVKRSNPTSSDEGE